MTRLLDILMPQVYDLNKIVEIEVDNHPTDSIGTKRNRLLQRAKGEYICFIDDDDRVSSDYVACLFDGIFRKVDCCALMGEITYDGQNPEKFHHSIIYSRYETFQKPVNGIKHIRFPNHLNCIRANIAKQFSFPEINHGEDTDFATQIHRSGQLMTEHYMENVIYYYDYRSKK
jgi:glycosyltransferase involved in cell wall biosynthesis